MGSSGGEKEDASPVTAADWRSASKGSVLDAKYLSTANVGYCWWGNDKQKEQRGGSDKQVNKMYVKQ